MRTFNTPFQGVEKRSIDDKWVITFQANVLFLFVKSLETSNFLKYSGGIETEHWPEMGQRPS